MGCLDSKPTPMQKNLLTNFVEYYKYVRRKLKAQDFKFKSPVDDISFKDRLAEATGVNKAIVKIWITLYIDYMILAAWALQLGNKMIIYPPYAIQQVLKLHTLYNKNYLAFNDIITDDKGAISYFPIRLASCQNAQEYNTLRDSYNWAKGFLKDNLYQNPAAHKSDTKKLQADGVWEDFETTAMQCEFNFCFLNSQDKEEFQKVLADHPTEVILANQSPEEIIRVVKALRGFLKAGDIVEDPQKTFAPKIQDDKVTEKDQSIFSRLNELAFSSNFVNILALEQRILIDEACKWVEEYKKFLFLIYASEGKVIMSPSEAVDQVWRLHMQFTEAYHHDMQMLRPVVYCPPKRSSGEINNGESEFLYVETLNVYTKYFGARNEKVWPSAEKRFQDVGRSASYYLFFARGCLTEEQKKKVMLKYTEYTKTKKGRKNSEYYDEYQYYNTSPGLGFDALILGMILMNDPFDFNDNYGYDDINHLGEDFEGSQILDDQSLNNYTLNNIEGDNLGMFKEAGADNNGGWFGGNVNNNDNGGGDNDDGDDDGGDDGGGD